jgi:hypothetical protein
MNIGKMNTNVQKTEMTKEKRMEGMHNDISSFARCAMPASYTLLAIQHLNVCFNK